ncbi:MAG: hypothetical protein R2860_09570 [Desulfobacterales bacterium]
MIDRETKKEVKTIPDAFIWEVLQDIARAWPEDKRQRRLLIWLRRRRRCSTSVGSPKGSGCKVDRRNDPGLYAHRLEH